MSLDEIIAHTTEFVRQHQFWAIPLVFILAFGESLAFLSLLLPATVMLLALGALIGEAGIDFWPVYASAVAGGFFGDWLSYWLGYHYQERLGQFWPFSRHPHMLARGQAFFDRWGIAGAFFGRFFGPLRAVVPLIAGICGMPRLYFQLANFGSAAVWAFGLLAPGAFGIQWISRFIG
ncbi:DedA family protein [Acerihabitans arboris]|uniref:DedA family protein n=1 Tax=Acerihabitans arboris TaxID=2691583 RepID=A0A845SNN4_9GAMM|nr:DedA family protein [Acerihabitans arboris]NDL64534.1 DedA family protein [Acerihabitans arboris]